MLRELGTSHEPTVPPGGPGLFHMKGKQLPGAMQHVFNDLIQSGHPHDGRTYALAIGIVKNWAHGKGAKDPAVIAKAQKAVSEWEKLKAEAHARSAKKDAKAVSESDEFILELSRLTNPFLRETWDATAQAARKLKHPDWHWHDGSAPAQLVADLSGPDPHRSEALMTRDASGFVHPDRQDQILSGELSMHRKTMSKQGHLDKAYDIKRGPATLGPRSTPYKPTPAQERKIASLHLGAAHADGSGVGMRSAVSRYGSKALKKRLADAGVNMSYEYRLREDDSLSEAWSEAARLAAAAARRGNHEAPFQGKNARGLNQAHVDKLNQHAPSGVKFGHTQSLNGTHMITVGRVPFAGSFGEHFTAPRVRDPLMASLEEGQPRKVRTGKYTNKFHGIDKKSRTHVDMMDEVKAAGHAGCGGKDEPVNELDGGLFGPRLGAERAKFEYGTLRPFSSGGGLSPRQIAERKIAAAASAAKRHGLPGSGPVVADIHKVADKEGFTSEGDHLARKFGNQKVTYHPGGKEFRAPGVHSPSTWKPGEKRRSEDYLGGEAKFPDTHQGRKALKAHLLMVSARDSHPSSLGGSTPMDLQEVKTLREAASNDGNPFLTEDWFPGAEPEDYLLHESWTPEKRVEALMEFWSPAARLAAAEARRRDHGIRVGPPGSAEPQAIGLEEHFHHKIRELRHGESIAVPLPEGELHITRRTPEGATSHHLRDFHIAGGGQNVDPKLRRGPRNLVGTKSIAREAAERVRASLTADAEHSRRLTDAVAGPHQRTHVVAHLTGHTAEIHRTTRGTYRVVHPEADNIPSHEHATAAEAVEHAKRIIRAKGGKFLEEGHDTDPLSTLSSTHRAIRQTRAEHLTPDRVKSAKEKYEGHNPDGFGADAGVSAIGSEVQHTIGHTLQPHIEKIEKAGELRARLSSARAATSSMVPSGSGHAAMIHLVHHAHHGVILAHHASAMFQGERVEVPGLPGSDLSLAEATSRDQVPAPTLTEKAMSKCPSAHAKMKKDGYKKCPYCKGKLDAEGAAEDATEKVEEAWTEAARDAARRALQDGGRLKISPWSHGNNRNVSAHHKGDIMGELGTHLGSITPASVPGSYKDHWHAHPDRHSVSHMEDFSRADHGTLKDGPFPSAAAAARALARHIGHGEGEIREELRESPLTAATRKALPDSAFVFPDKRSYPIHDLSHAKNALARSSGKPEEAKVKAAVYSRYPALKEELVEKWSEAARKAASAARGGKARLRLTPNGPSLRSVDVAGKHLGIVTQSRDLGPDQYRWHAHPDTSDLRSGYRYAQRVPGGPFNDEKAAANALLDHVAKGGFGGGTHTSLKEDEQLSEKWSPQARAAAIRARHLHDNVIKHGAKLQRHIGLQADSEDMEKAERKLHAHAKKHGLPENFDFGREWERRTNKRPLRVAVA